jgi:hypothetical protein
LQAARLYSTTAALRNMPTRMMSVKPRYVASSTSVPSALTARPSCSAKGRAAGQARAYSPQRSTAQAPQQGLYGSGLQQAYDQDAQGAEPFETCSYNPEFRNVVTMTGTLGFDPEQVVFANGGSVAKLRIAHPQPKQGEGWYVEAARQIMHSAAVHLMRAAERCHGHIIETSLCQLYVSG